MIGLWDLNAIDLYGVAEGELEDEYIVCKVLMQASGCLIL